MKNTDSALGPSEWFLEIIKPYFFEQGFEYKKSAKKFIRKNDNGFHQVDFWFKISTYCQVSLRWGLQVDKLEKVYAEICGTPRKYKSSLTLFVDLSNYIRMENDGDHTIPLYDPNDYQYSDMSINIAAVKIRQAFEKYVVPFFEKYNNYLELERFYNEQEYKQVKGLILAKYFEREDFKDICSIFSEQIKTRNLNEDCDEMKLYHKTIDYLTRNDVKRLLD